MREGELRRGPLLSRIASSTESYVVFAVGSSSFLVRTNVKHNKKSYRFQCATIPIVFLSLSLATVFLSTAMASDKVKSNARF